MKHPAATPLPHKDFSHLRFPTHRDFNVELLHEKAYLMSIQTTHAFEAFDQVWKAYRPLLLEYLEALLQGTGIDPLDVFQILLIRSWEDKRLGTYETLGHWLEVRVKYLVTKLLSEADQRTQAEDYFVHDHPHVVSPHHTLATAVTTLAAA